MREQIYGPPEPMLNEFRGIREHLVLCRNACTVAWDGLPLG